MKRIGLLWECLERLCEMEWPDGWTLLSSTSMLSVKEASKPRLEEERSLTSTNTLYLPYSEKQRIMRSLRWLA
jgi:hypothetical protein